MEVRVAQAVLRNAVERGRRDHTAEGARNRVTGVVGHDQENVRRALRRNDARGPEGLGLPGRILDYAAKLLRRRRKLIAIDRRRRTRRARIAADLLGYGGIGNQHDKGSKCCAVQ